MKLVHDLPPERVPEYEDLVTVFEGDSNSAAVARAAVESAGITSWTKDEEVHGLFPSLGPTEILVGAEDKKPALEALETPQHYASTPPDSGHSTSRQFLSTPCADNAFASGAQLKRKQQHKEKTK